MVVVGGFLKVARHLDSGVLVAALGGVEGLIAGPAVQDRLVATDGAGHGLERPHHGQSEPLSPVLLCHRDLLYVRHLSVRVDAVACTKY